VIYHRYRGFDPPEARRRHPATSGASAVANSVSAPFPPCAPGPFSAFFVMVAPLVPARWTGRSWRTRFSGRPGSRHYSVLTFNRERDIPGEDFRDGHDGKAQVSDGRFKRIPLALRAAVYGAGFLVLVLGGLPYLLHRLDVRFPAVHLDIGPMRIIGVGLAAIGLMLYSLAAVILISRGEGGHVEFDPPTRFVVTGPYRYARNPVAACLLISMLGEAIAFSSTGIFILFCAAVALAHMQVTRIEEPFAAQALRTGVRRVPRTRPALDPPPTPMTGARERRTARMTAISHPRCPIGTRTCRRLA